MSTPKIEKAKAALNSNKYNEHNNTGLVDIFFVVESNLVLK
jgi:hypothetical protein